MNLTVRLLIALALLGGAVLFVSAIAEGPAPDAAPEDAPASNGRADPDIFAGAKPAKPGVLDSPENCRECHEEIYDEWLRDRHRHSWTGELFLDLSKNHSDPNCFSCHAPRPIYETGLNSPAETRANFRDTGINCLTCHVRGNHVVGPIPDPQDTPEVTADCGPVYDPDYPSATNQAGTSEFCGVCHNLHGTCDEFAGSEYAREGKTCLSCHMEETTGPIAKGGKPRKRRVHHLPGGHSPQMLKRALELDVRREDGTLVARVTNAGAGHKVPTDARHRGIYLRASFTDAYGQPVLVDGPNGPERDVVMDLIRLFYRHEQKEPTQIDPQGTLGKDPWRESSVAIPAAARGGKAHIRLYYLLRYDWPMRKGTLVAERTVSLDDE